MKFKIISGTLFALIGVLVIFFLIAYLMSLRRTPNMIYGVSFDVDYANYLKLNPKNVFIEILDKWKFKHIRLSVFWEKIEAERGRYNFADLDWYMNEARKRDAKVVLAVGQKTPRWPECHLPGWSLGLPKSEYDTALYGFVKQTVGRYKNNPALEIWQVENEPFLRFGVCPAFSSQMLQEELKIIKEADPTHPTLITDSGELSTWRRTANAGDLFGTTMYRMVWNKYIGYWSYDWLPAYLYQLKAVLNGRDINKAYIMELQAEPWITNRPVEEMPLSEQYRSMNLERLEKNIDYASRVGMPRAYLWGAEWWYWLEKKGVPEIPTYIKDLKKY